MAETHTVNIRDLKRDFSLWIRRVSDHGLIIIVTLMDGEQAAALVPYKWYQDMLKLQGESDA